MKNRIAFCLISLVVMLSSCEFLGIGGAEKTPPKTVNITDVGYTIENYPSDWWSSTSTYKPSLVYEFAIVYSGDLKVSDVEYARIYLPNSTSYWPLDPVNNMDTANGEIYGYDFSYSDSYKELPIGTMKAEMKLTNGAISDFSFTMGQPGSVTAGGYTYAYSKDAEGGGAFYQPLYPNASVPAVMRPTVDGLSNALGAITVNFTVHGSNIANGFSWFFDAAGNYLGVSRSFLDPTSGAVSSRLNGGVFNKSDGLANVLTLRWDQSDITHNSVALTAAEFVSIAHCRVVVKDGAQYGGQAGFSYSTYDYRATSAYF